MFQTSFQPTELPGTLYILVDVRMLGMVLYPPRDCDFSFLFAESFWKIKKYPLLR